MDHYLFPRVVEFYSFFYLAIEKLCAFFEHDAPLAEILRRIERMRNEQKRNIFSLHYLVHLLCTFFTEALISYAERLVDYQNIWIYIYANSKAKSRLHTT